MWKISRNLIFPRWHASKQTPVETKPKKTVPSNVLVTLSSGKQKYSDESHHKEHFRKESKRFWNCNQFLFRPLFLETAGWLGAVTVLCFDFHYKYFNSIYKNDKKTFHCIFSRNVLAMPKSHAAKQSIHSAVMPPDKQLLRISEEIKDSEVTVESNLVDDLKINAGQYIAAFQNSAGVSCSDSNSKKAFRHFQKAARLGSIQGFYNLGLCYELGKGTKVNLNRAAFCYKKAAMKGHGMASYNLAVFLLKGLGNLPVDHDTAKLLIAEAADKDIPEAQLYMGIVCLEEKKLSDAFEVFDNLAKRNNLDGKYYLGLCYANGWGVNQDEKLAVEIFSQTAALGHTKSLLKLSQCYEVGLGSCDSDLDFAEALCQILVDQGDDTAKKALKRLKTKKENMYVKDSFSFQLPSMKLGKTIIHASASVPELTSKYRKTNYSSITSSYSQSVSYFPAEPNSLQVSKKASFFVGDDMNLSLPTCYLPCYQSNLMTAKT